MADPNVPINPVGGPTFSQRLWSEEVAIARAESGEIFNEQRAAMSSPMAAKFDTPTPTP